MSVYLTANKSSRELGNVQPGKILAAEVPTMKLEGSQLERRVSDFEESGG